MLPNEIKKEIETLNAALSEHFETNEQFTGLRNFTFFFARNARKNKLTEEELSKGLDLINKAEAQLNELAPQVLEEHPMSYLKSCFSRAG
ncbi:MAG: hypothetical protein WC785_01855 [Tatlockia sp.]|jgi:hypothetical protein